MNEQFIPTLEDRLETLNHAFQFCGGLKNTYWASDELKRASIHICEAAWKDMERLKGEKHE